MAQLDDDSDYSQIRHHGEEPGHDAEVDQTRPKAQAHQPYDIIVSSPPSLFSARRAGQQGTNGIGDAGLPLQNPIHSESNRHINAARPRQIG